MKKLALLLVLVLAVSLSACGKVNTDTPDTPDTQTTTTTTVAIPEKSDTFALGTVVNGTYQNAFFGLGFSLDDQWTIDNAAACNPSLSQQAGGDIAAAAEAAQCFYDVMASSVNGVISVYVENLSLLWDYIPSVDEYVEMQKAMCEGNPNITVADVTANVGSLPCKGLQITVSEYQTDVFYYIPMNNYMISLGFSGTNADFAAQYLADIFTF